MFSNRLYHKFVLIMKKWKDTMKVQSTHGKGFIKQKSSLCYVVNVHCAKLPLS